MRRRRRKPPGVMPQLKALLVHGIVQALNSGAESIGGRFAYGMCTVSSWILGLASGAAAASWSGEVRRGAESG